MRGLFLSERRAIEGQNRVHRWFREGQFSQVINTMRNAGIHFNKKLVEMQFQLNSLNKTRAALRCAGDKNRDDRTLRLRYNRCDEGGDRMALHLSLIHI